MAPVVAAGILSRDGWDSFWCKISQEKESTPYFETQLEGLVCAAAISILDGILFADGNSDSLFRFEFIPGLLLLS